MAAASGDRIVLVAVDASDNAKDAFRWYLSDIYRERDFVVICHVPELADLSSLSLKQGLSLPVDEWHKAMKDHLDKVNGIKETYENELLLKKIKHKFRTEQAKNAGQGIIAAAESESASFIVVGSRGQDALRRTFLGSVSDYVVHHSKLPVIVCTNKST